MDTYGGWGAHGGGAFSGKDYTKVGNFIEPFFLILRKNLAYEKPNLRKIHRFFLSYLNYFVKVDRSAAYAARWVAKSLVKAGLAKRCLVQVRKRFCQGCIKFPIKFFGD